ncbi:hypothetical protein JQ604_20075 [Bradyrhizobium jicamae]|nr:hypothetical protein [Bradyrhizobium jicamae]MBR0754488.1 hypothetical protein [Bradyrhizobium jicamae]
MTSPRSSFSSFRRAVRKLIETVFDPYRPERHYMRGPGPKWRAKHAIG